MNRIILLAAMAIVMTTASLAVALDNMALFGTWKLVETAKDKNGKPSPFVGKQILFTSDGNMMSDNMPMPFKYNVDLDKAAADKVIARLPELKGMDIMLVMPGNFQGDWSRAPIVYGVKLKGNQLIMKVSGYTPARYKKQK
jgi:hypothetical protein